MKININQELCTRCGKCVKVCPSEIFFGKEIVGIHNEDSCIKCGHCAAVCDFEAMEHELFPSDKVHKIDYSQMPTPEQVMLLTKMRRSMRIFSSKAIPMPQLNMILEAAHRAPTATNSQKISFTLVTDIEKIKSISRFTLDTFASVVRKIDNPLGRMIVKRLQPSMMRYLPLFKQMQERFEQGDDKILRGATAVILIHTPSWNRFGAEDANLAYQNGSLMAEALGIGQFYGGFVLTAARQRKGEMEKMLGIDGKICAVMALGVPKFRYANYIDRKDITCNKI